MANVFGLGISDFIQVVNAAIIAATLLFVAMQAFYTRKSLENAALQSRYLMYFELNKLLVEDPTLQFLISRKEAVDKLKASPVDELKRKSFIELILDMAEFNFLVSPSSHKEHVMAYLEKLASNSEIRRYWNSPERGTFQPRFTEAMNDFTQRS